MERISVIIPVFRESACLEGLLSRLNNDGYANKEVVVVIDEPSQSSMNLIRRFEETAIFIVNRRRKGKVSALNGAAGRSTGKILFFLDSDNVITGDSVLSRVVSGMKGKDIVEFQIDTIGNSFIAKLVGIEFANANLTNMLYSRYSARKPIIGGAEFSFKTFAKVAFGLGI